MEEGVPIAIYQAKNQKTEIEVRLEQETVWLTQKQMGVLFGRDYKTIAKHVSNIFKEGELEKEAVVANFAITASDGKTYQVNHYNLDVIISVGYRVKSLEGTQFRIWANKILKEHLIKGYTLNERRLREQTEAELQHLRKTINLLDKTAQQARIESDEAASLIHLINDYASGLALLDQYDHGQVRIPSSETSEVWQLDYAEAIRAINQLKASYEAGSLFGHEKDDSFQSSLNTIYQTFDGQPLYPSLEEKAANLLYLIIKNHSFSDGNKRIGAYLFLVFLDQNNMLYHDNGESRIANNALVSLTLMIAESNPSEKELIVNLVVNLISDKG
jgi:prophage maintenance system killer protein